MREPFCGLLVVTRGGPDTPFKSYGKRVKASAMFRLSLLCFYMNSRYPPPQPVKDADARTKQILRHRPMPCLDVLVCIVQAQARILVLHGHSCRCCRAARAE